MAHSARHALKSSAVLSGLLLAMAAQAAGPIDNVRDGHEPTPDPMGNIPQKIIHPTLPERGSLASPFGNPSYGARPGATAPTAGSTAASANPITYHGGPIMPSVSKVVVIWYGNWNQTNGTDNAEGKSIIRDALYGLANDASTSGMTNVSGITTGVNTNLGQYTQSSGGPVGQVSSSTVAECTQAATSAYGGAKLSDKTVLALVKAAAGGTMTTCTASPSPSSDPNAIYLVLSSSEISETSGFLTRYCGWHTFSTVNGVPLKYGFIGNPARKLSACAAQTVSPNGNAGVDAMISVIAHELEEAVTDPQLNAWYNSSGSENADMCAWTFGSNLAYANGAYSNATLPTPTGSRKYLIQRALGVSNSKCYAAGGTTPVQ